jgi:uncharacterized membrane protein required for colicin V production
MNYVMDVSLLVLLIISFVIGFKKGLIRSVVDLFGGIISALLAAFVGARCSEWLYDKLFRPSVLGKVTDAIGTSQGADAVTNVFKSLPDFIVRLFNLNGVTEQTVMKAINNQTDNMAEIITDAISPLLIAIIKVFIIIFLFLLFMIILKAIASALTKLFSVPVLHQINGLLGGLFGLCLGLLIIWVFLGALNFFEPMMTTADREKLTSTVNSTYIAKVVTDLNPVKWIYF